MAEEARIIIDAQLQFRHDSEAAWLEHDPVLKAGEPAYTLGYPDRFKLGDGQSKWSELPYIKPGEGGGGGGGGSQSYESLTWSAIKSLTAGDPSVLPQAFAVKQAYNELKSLIPALDDYYTKTQVNALIPSLAGYATETFVNTAIANLINGAPTTLDTLKEIADALADNADVVKALESAIGTKADKTTVDALDTRLDTAEANISTNTTNITAQGKTIASHTSSINTLSSDVSGLKTSVSDLEDLFDSDGKALKAVTADNATKLNGQAASYYATAASVKSVSDSLANYALKTRKISAGTGLTGGGDLTADRTLSLATSGVTAGTYTKTTVDAYGRVTGGTTLSASDIPALAISKITNLQTTLDGLRTDVDNALADAGDNAAAIVTLTSNLSKLTTRVSTAETNITNLTNNKLNKSIWDSVFEIDANGNLKVKVGLYSTSFISARGADANAGGGGSGGAFSLYTWTQVKALTSEVGGVAPTAYALKQAYNEINASLDSKASTSSVTALTTRVASLESKATSVSVSQTLTTGTEIGKITIDGVSKALYAPSSIAWGSVTGKPTFATVATSGKYSDLSGLPTIPTNNNQLANGAGYITASAIPSTYAWSAITGKPTFAAVATSGSYNDLSNKPSIPSIAGLASETWVSNNYLPLSGGTLTGLLLLEYANPRIAFKSDANTTLGAVGFKDGVLSAHITADNKWYSLIHTGNIGSYAFLKAATKLTSSDTLDADLIGLYAYQDGANPTNSFGNNAAVLSLKGTKGNPTFQLAFAGNEGTIGYKVKTTSGTWQSWKTIAFTDSTVLAANKLVTSAGEDAVVPNAGGYTLVFGDLGVWAQDASERYVRLRNSRSDLYTRLKADGSGEIFVSGMHALKLGTGNTTKMLINSSGNVTIGSSDLASTKYKLAVDGSLAMYGTGNATYPSLIRSNATNGLELLMGVDANNNKTGLLIGWRNWTDVAMAITSSGNVLIGTTEDNGKKLQVNGDIATSGNILFNHNKGLGFATSDGKTISIYVDNYNNFHLGYQNVSRVRFDSGNVLIGSVDDSGEKLQVNGSISMGNSDTSELYMNRGYYNRFIATQNNGRFAWRVNGVESDVMELSTAGHLLIGTTTDSNFHLDVSGNARVAGITATTGTFSGKVTATGTIYSATGLYSSGYVSGRGADTSSDRRLKDNIAPLRNALSYVLGTNYVSFDWKDTREKSIGIIAQEEMGREWGCLVQKHSENYSYLYGQHTALLGAAIQEEDKKVEELKAEISRLKAEVKDLKTRLNS